ncbi:MAG: CRISPR-associated helicase/endonuclease Cas3 [Desulfoprunum sp.]|nr:CRISPR-associated helicase/endonuclease Cas3 [Desulfoprunum sp.]
MELETYYRYWGKAEKEGSNYHLLPYHCLDVTAVASVWWAASPAIRRSFLLQSNLPEEQVRAWVLFFIALHDYGKFDVRFQLRVKPIWQLLYPDAGIYGALPSVQECKSYYHGEGGLSWFIQDHEELLFSGAASTSDGWDFLDTLSDSDSGQWSSWKLWIEAVTGHHGHIQSTDYASETSLPPVCDRRLAGVDREARNEWLSALDQLFLKHVGLSLSDSPPAYSQTFLKTFLAGFCSVVDWLGSRCDEINFIFCREPKDLREYFEERSAADARRVLELAGIVGHPRQYASVGALLEPDKQPRSLQTLVDILPQESGLTLVEAPTGSGKTEAAMAYAWRLIGAGLADSIVFALPSQATANAMLGRLERIAPILFHEHPNLLLAHGKARFNKDFSKIKHAALDGYEKEDGWVQCSQWLAESRKRVFLGQVGVCTVDQVLISVLPVRHRFVRGFGLGRSVLIVDEVHAYDAYMYGLLEEVLRQQKASGGAAILLSATLPEQQRQQLCEAWDAILEQRGADTPYPLATWTTGDTATFFELDPVQLPEELIIKAEPIRITDMIPDEALLRRVVVAAEAGAQVAIVCNLVDVAQQLARRLRTMTDLPVDLFHARYCYSHRQEKELAAIKCFGPVGERTSGRILVATQVVEQSLDVDFDWLITQLCPVDLLFQRMGRLHRHLRTNRPLGFEKPLCTVLLPDDTNYGVHGVIYANTRVLWRTAEKLLSVPDGKIVFPGAYRSWIESVYQEDAWGNEPEEVEKGYEKFKYEIEEIKRYKARYMVDTAMNPFSDTDENVTAVTRDGEMNLSVVPFCWTPQGKMLMDGKIFELLDEYQRLEALSLNSVGVPKTWGYCLEEPDEWRYWLEMEQDGDGFRGSIKGVTFRYHKDFGLEKEK